MGRLLAGGLIILFLLLAELLAAFIVNDVTSFTAVANCSESENATVCNNVGQTTFFESVKNVAVEGFPGAPDIANAIWLLITGTLLSIAVLLIVLAFLPTTSE